MVQSIWDDVKRGFSYGNMVTRIIIVNVAVYVLVNLIYVGIWFYAGMEPDAARINFNAFLKFFSMPADWRYLLTHPWGIFTSMFLHEGFWHLLWNMLFLYWFGRIVGDFIGNQRILPIYLLGGLVGAITFFISVYLVNYPAEFAYGASAGVMAIVLAAGAISPDYIIRLLFIGDVKLKYIVAVLVFLDIVFIPRGGNTGGHFAHLGGAFLGWLYVRQLRQGADMAVPVNQFFSAVAGFFGGLIGGARKGPKVVYKNPNRYQKEAGREPRRKAAGKPGQRSDLSHQEQVDAILDKIKKTGYDSLSSEEKEFLFNASKKQ